MKIIDSHLTIYVANMDVSIAFYESIGFELQNRWDNHYAQLTAPGISIGLHPKGESTASHSGNLSIGFTVDGFDQASSRLKELGIQAEERNEKGGQFLHFKDPDGTALYMILPKW